MSFLRKVGRLLGRGGKVVTPSPIEITPTGAQPSLAPIAESERRPPTTAIPIGAAVSNETLGDMLRKTYFFGEVETLCTAGGQVDMNAVLQTIRNMLHGLTQYYIFRTAEGVKGTFDKDSHVPATLPTGLQFSAATIAYFIFPAVFASIPPEKQGSYSIDSLRSDLVSAVNSLKGPEGELTKDKKAAEAYHRVRNAYAGHGFAGIKATALEMVRALKDPQAVKDSLTKRLDEVKAYMTGREGDIKRTVDILKDDTNTSKKSLEKVVEDASSNPARAAEVSRLKVNIGECKQKLSDLSEARKYLLGIARYLQGVYDSGGPVAADLGELDQAVGYLRRFKVEIGNQNKALQGNLEKLGQLLNDAYRLRKVRGYLNLKLTDEAGNPITIDQMDNLNAFDIAYTELDLTAKGRASKVTMEGARQLDEHRRKAEEQSKTMAGLERDHEDKVQEHQALSANLQRVLGDLREALEGFQKTRGLDPAIKGPLEDTLKLYELFHKRLEKKEPLPKSGFIFDDGAKLQEYLIRLFTGVADVLKKLGAEAARTYTLANASPDVNQTMIAGNAADWCAFVYDYALEEVKGNYKLERRDENIVGTTEQMVRLRQLAEAGTAVDAANVAPLLKRLESANGETESELVAKAERIRNGAILLGGNAREAHIDNAFARARAEIYQRNLEYHLSEPSIGIKLYDGSNDPAVLMRNGIRAKVDDIYDGEVKRKVERAVEKFSEVYLRSQVSLAKGQTAALRAQSPKIIQAGIDEREAEIRADEREKTLAELRKERSRVRGVYKVFASPFYLAGKIADCVGLGNLKDRAVSGLYSLVGKKPAPLDYNLIRIRQEKVLLAEAELAELQARQSLTGTVSSRQVRAAKTRYRAAQRSADRGAA